MHAFTSKIDKQNSDNAWNIGVYIRRSQAKNRI